MINIVQRFDTQYFVAHMAIDLRHLFNTISKEEIVDIANARISTDSMNVINDAIRNGYNVIDSANMERMKIIQESKERLIAPVVELTPLPEIRSIDDIIPTIRAMDSNLTYKINSTEFDYLFVIVATYARPKLKFNLDGNWISFFEFIVDKLDYKDNHWSKWNYISGNTFVSIEQGADGKFYVPGKGHYDYQTFLKEFTALPYEFGTAKLGDKPFWTEFIEKCLVEIEEILYTKPKTIKEVI